ncbi:RNA exonuclease 1 [Trichuris trichiura]|uniref:RNA exonuclease 1 n=1 Tax=Trichuris trichiura TaxID=36087 RepID=A0A077ZDP4_TRITR|nr:RNA exonuclease 1 [Trichuris trichiura]
MFTSLGFWRSIPCPYLDSDKPCQRPYCQFKHTEENADNDESSILNGISSRIDQDCQPPCSTVDIPRVQKLAIPVEPAGKDDSLPVQTSWVPKTKPLVYKPTPIAELRKRKRIKEELQTGKTTAAESGTSISSANYVEANSADSFEDKASAPTNSCVEPVVRAPECPIDESSLIDLTEVSSNVPNTEKDLENEVEENPVGVETPSESILALCDAKDSEQPEEAETEQCVIASSEQSGIDVSGPIVEISDEQPPIENDEPIEAEGRGCVLHVANVFGDDSDDDEEFRKAYSSRVSFRKGLAAPLAPHAFKGKVNAEQTAFNSVEIDDSGYSSFDRRPKLKAESPPLKKLTPHRISPSSTVKPVIVKAPVIRCAEEVTASLQDEVDYQEALIMKKRRISKVVSCDKSDEKPRVAFNPKCRIPISIRQRYLDLFVEECLKQCPDKQEAFTKASAEEESVAALAHSTKGYTVSAVNRLRRLRCSVSTALVPAQMTSGSTNGGFTFFQADYQWRFGKTSFFVSSLDQCLLHLVVL